MYIYFLKSGEDLKNISPLWYKFVQVMESLGFRVLADTGKKRADLDKADIFVIEVSSPSTRVGYAVAYALVRRKPVLCLRLPEVKVADLSYLTEGISTKLLKLEEYTPKNLVTVLETYLRQKQKKEIATTKFTLRVPSSFVEYLTWKKGKSGRSKASIIRDEFIDQIIRKDPDFQKYLSQRTS